MNYLKGYKLFESSIVIHTPYKSIMYLFLDELGLTLDELNDIFVSMLDFDFNTYLQIFYLDKNGSSWSRVPDIISEEHPFIPYLSISFNRENELTKTIKNSKNGSVVLFEKIDLLESFVDSIHRLKSMLSDKEIYWSFNEKGSEVRIYFDEITKEIEPEEWKK